MKKIILKIMAGLMLLSLITVASCRKEAFDLNNPDRPRIPMIAELEGPIGVTEKREETFTASSEFSTSFVWRRGGVIIEGETTNTLTISASGFFPDVAAITVAGANVSGVGAFSSPNTIMFTPWEKPGEAFIVFDTNVYDFIDDTLRNECPVGFILLTARIWQAADYFWYLDGELIEGEAGPTLRIEGDTSLNDLVIGSGRYTVRGANAFGESPMSDPIDVLWTECEDGIVAGLWFATADWAMAPATDEWLENFVLDIDLGGYAMTNFGGAGGPGVIRQDETTEKWYFPSDVVVGEFEGQELVQFIGLWINDYSAITMFLNLTIEGVPGLPVIFADDMQSFEFPTMAMGTVENQSGIEVILVIRRRPIGGSGTGTAWHMAADDLSFRRPASDAPAQKGRIATELPSVLLKGETIEMEAPVRRQAR
jgi:hypothetical protein